MFSTTLISLLALLPATVSSFSLNTNRLGSSAPRQHHLHFMMSQPANDDNNHATSSSSSSSSEPEWGVSFIGGDPCGSKYNTDPHDAKISKPGMPDDMKARIAAKAEQKKRKAAEAALKKTE